ncbi:4Fe-4S single cluster domain-containing protein [Spiroplasma endosymbiont of Labia minor]|uniref:4Fe-4S single cluster domain-containing protein n=1 Tax=Spiroplasma endosymbiont of Labia minor TaxID=3066305 RepID=UPI0030D08E86
MANLNINKFIEKSEVEGPGNRFVIWFQGCTINCFGCCNQELVPLEKKMFMSVDILVEKILISKKMYNLEGITIIGGEPFLQPDGLEELVIKCQEYELSVICFTGFTFEVLENHYWQILSQIDILIDGPFILSKLDKKRRLIGSTNQRVIKITDKYKESNYFDEQNQELEIFVENGFININGDGVLTENSIGINKFKVNDEHK